MIQSDLNDPQNKSRGQTNYATVLTLWQYRLHCCIYDQNQTFKKSFECQSSDW